MDRSGSITIEIAIVLVIILMITGIILSFSEVATDKMIKTVESEHMENLIVEFVDNLINNPGNPEDWATYGGTPGLAIVNENGDLIPNSVSYAKFIALGNDYKNLITKKNFNSEIKTSMELIPKESSISSVKIGLKEDSNNIYSVNRLVKCDFYKKYVLKDFQNTGKCNHGDDQQQYSCNYFKVFPGNLRSSEYYLLISDDEKDLKYIIDTTRVVKSKFWESVPSKNIYLNNKIEFYDDTSAVVFIHFDKPQAKAVLVSVPKNFDRNNLKYDYFTTNDCEFILRAWY